MKKNIIRILILIAILGIFSPVFAVAPPNQPEPENTKYQLLTKLPDPNAGGTLVEEIDTGAGLGVYLNLMIKLIIGISAVLAVVMIVMGGIEYIGSELISNKEEGRERIKNALLGLLIAMGAWALLNTINPDLLNSDVKIPTATVIIESFPVSGAQTRTGQPGAPVSFKKEACPAAQIAQNQTRVDKALVLAIFAQETASGKNTGGCKPANANMYPSDIEALGKIVGVDKVANTNVSCASGGGRGGAIGLMQFRPTTWLETVGGNKDPWKTEDALLAASIYLQKQGAITDPRNAACKYYSGSACQPGRNPPNEFYGDQVMSKMASINKQITEGGCS